MYMSFRRYLLCTSATASTSIFISDKKQQIKMTAFSNKCKTEVIKLNEKKLIKE